MALKENDQLISDSQRQADILNNQFFSMFTKADNCFVPAMGTSLFPEASDIILTEAVVKKLLWQLRIHTAPGRDQLQTRVLKDGADELTPVITLLFQASVNQHIIPEEWKKATIVLALRRVIGAKWRITDPSP